MEKLTNDENLDSLSHSVKEAAQYGIANLEIFELLTRVLWCRVFHLFEDNPSDNEKKVHMSAVNITQVTRKLNELFLYGFTILRKDRKNRVGGGVAVMCRNDWKIKEISNLCSEFECLWTKIKTLNSEFFVATVYHPPNSEYNQCDLVEFLIDSIEKLLLINPNSKIIIAGDINQLDIKMLTNHMSFVQLVKSATRGQRILDVFLTNVPHFWKKIKVEKSLVRSDHNMVLVYPREVVKADRREIFFRDVRCHNQIKMMRELEHVDWDVITSREKTSDEMVNTFYEIIYPLFEKCFPRIRVKLSSRDPPFISPLVKHLLNLRKKATAKHDLEL